MLKIKMEVENWSGFVVSDDLDECEIDALADELQGDVLRGLSDAGVEYKRAYQQSVGAGVALQAGGSAVERSLFGQLLCDCAAKINARTRTTR